MRWAPPVALAVLSLALANRLPAQSRDSVDIGRRYATELAVLGEPDLQHSKDTAEIYRVVWLRSFHEAVAVRLVRDGSRLWVITAQGPVWGQPATTPPHRDSLALSARAWSDLQLRTAMHEFWSTNAPPRPGGVDGARWILEGRKGGRYHAVDWWSPRGEEGREGGYRLLVLDILSLGTVCVKPDAVY